MLDAYISGSANLFGLLSATATGSLKYHKGKDVNPNNFISPEMPLKQQKIL